MTVDTRSHPTGHVTAPIIECRGVTKTYQTVPVLNGIDLRVARGEVICIVGPSGGGKSTLLRTLNGLETIDDGVIDVLGYRLPGSRESIRHIRAEVGMLFQNFNLFAHLSVRRNLTIAPMRTRNVPRAQAEARAEQLLERVGIHDQIDKYPAQLSGGQQQRVAIARALVTNPTVLLADEPTGNLDSQRGREIMELLRTLNTERGITIVMVTHEPDMAAYAGRVVRFVDGRVASDTPTPAAPPVPEPA